MSVQSSTPRLRLVLLATRAPIALCTVTAMAAAAARPHVIRRALALGAELVVESGGDFASSSSKQTKKEKKEKKKEEKKKEKNHPLDTFGGGKKNQAKKSGRTKKSEKNGASCKHNSDCKSKNCHVSKAEKDSGKGKCKKQAKRDGKATNSDKKNPAVKDSMPTSSTSGGSISSAAGGAM